MKKKAGNIIDALCLSTARQKKKQTAKQKKQTNIKLSQLAPKERWLALWEDQVNELYAMISVDYPNVDRRMIESLLFDSIIEWELVDPFHDASSNAYWRIMDILEKEKPGVEQYDKEQRTSKKDKKKKIKYEPFKEGKDYDPNSELRTSDKKEAKHIFKLPKKVWQGIKTVREMGIASMFDIKRVKNLLRDYGYDEAVAWITKYPSRYTRVVMEGRSAFEVV